MEYLFVLSDKGGWWLKIDSVKQLEDYHKKTDGARYEATLDRILHGEDPYELLEKAHIGVTPGIDFGSQTEGFLRLSYANSIENLREAMRRLEQYIRNA